MNMIARCRRAAVYLKLWWLTTFVTEPKDGEGDMRFWNAVALVTFISLAVYFYLGGSWGRGW